MQTGHEEVQDVPEDILQISAKPNCGGRAESEFCDDLVATIEYLANLDRIKPFCPIIRDALLLNLFAHGKPLEAVVWEYASSKTRARHFRGGQPRPGTTH